MLGRKRAHHRSVPTQSDHLVSGSNGVHGIGNPRMSCATACMARFWGTHIYTWNPDNPIIFGRWVFYGFLRAFRGNYGRLGNLWAFCFWLLKLRIIMGV